MPLWDYTCPSCAFTKEFLVRLDLSDAPSHCGAPMVRGQAAPAFVVKGYNAKNHYAQTTKELPASVHGQTNTKVTVSGNL